MVTYSPAVRAQFSAARYSASEPSQPSRPGTGWWKSSRSNPSQNCVEILVAGSEARIRDRKKSVGPMLACASEGLSALVDSIRGGDLRHPAARRPSDRVPPAESDQPGPGQH